MSHPKRTWLLATAAVLAVAVSTVPTTTAAASETAPVKPPPAANAPNPKNFVPNIDNPYFPLVPGNTNVYTGQKDGKSAVVIFEVTHKTKKILGVTTRVIHDRLFLDGVLEEDTLDWYAQDISGTVWYFGEATKVLDPQGNVVTTEGSFEAGVDGALQGVFMPAKPVVGATYQQEFYAGHAEDRATILSLNKTVTIPAGTFTHVMLTKEFTPLEPAVRGGKLYARGIGNIREFDLAGGNEHLELLTVLHGG
jgi:hypothetical protein